MEHVSSNVSWGWVGSGPGKGPGETQAEDLFHASSVALDPVKTWDGSLLISRLPVMIRILKEELQSYECRSLKCQKSVWLILYFVYIQLVQSSNIFLLIISDNLAVLRLLIGFGRKMLVRIEISCSQSLKSLVDK